MTIRSLFNIILKIIGVLFIKDVLAAAPQLLSFFLYFSSADTIDSAFWLLLLQVIILLLYGFVAYYFIFRSNWLIDKLKLDKGFAEDTISLNFHRSSVLSIAIILIGGLMVADELPNFCRLVFTYFNEKQLTFSFTNPSTTFIILSGVKIVIGLLLIGNQRQIVNLIEYKRRKATVIKNENNDEA